MTRIAPDRRTAFTAYLRRVPICSVVLLGGLTALIVANGVRVHLLRYDDSVSLPNGMILRRELEIDCDHFLCHRDRHDMFAADGHRRLAKDIEFVCFNDRYVEIIPFPQGWGGLYDGAIQDAVPRNDLAVWAAYLASDLHSWSHSCNGYYRLWLGPGFLYDGLDEHSLPSCFERNFDNEALANRSWFERPCRGIRSRSQPPRTYAQQGGL